jgi:hypothetical protein
MYGTNVQKVWETIKKDMVRQNVKSIEIELQNLEFTCEDAKRFKQIIGVDSTCSISSVAKRS